MPVPQHWLPPAEHAKALEVDEARFTRAAKMAELRGRFARLIERQKETSAEIDRACRAVREVGRDDGA
jgi:hypothetical protein